VVDVRERADNWRIAGDLYADIESITVIPVARGQGVGTALMQEVYRRLQSFGIDELTRQSSSGIRKRARFYERKGFRAWTVNYLGRASDPNRSSAEMVEVVDGENHTVDVVPRSVIRGQNLLHRTGHTLSQPIRRDLRASPDRKQGRLSRRL